MEGLWIFLLIKTKEHGVNQESSVVLLILMQGIYIKHPTDPSDTTNIIILDSFLIMKAPKAITGTARQGSKQVTEVYKQLGKKEEKKEES